MNNFSVNYVSSIAWASCVLPGNQRLHPMLTEHQYQVSDIRFFPVLLLKMWSMDQQHWCHLRAHQECTTSSLTSTNLDLPFSKISRWLEWILKLENCPGAHLLSKFKMVGKSIRNNHPTKTQSFPQKMWWRWHQQYFLMLTSETVILGKFRFQEIL